MCLNAIERDDLTCARQMIIKFTANFNAGGGRRNDGGTSEGDGGRDERRRAKIIRLVAGKTA